MNDASTTRERADSVTLPPETKSYLNVSASGFLSLGCRPAHHRLSVTLGPGVASSHRNPSHTSVDLAMLRGRPVCCKTNCTLSVVRSAQGPLLAYSVEKLS